MFRLPTKFFEGPYHIFLPIFKEFDHQFVTQPNKQIFHRNVRRHLKPWCASDCQCAIYFRLITTNQLSGKTHGVIKVSKKKKKHPQVSHNVFRSSCGASSEYHDGQATSHFQNNLPGNYNISCIPLCRTFEDIDLRLFPRVKGVLNGLAIKLDFANYRNLYI